MMDFFEVEEGRLPMTLAALRRVLKRREGWREVKLLQGAYNYIFATRPDGKQIRFQNCSTPDTTQCAGVIANDKLATYYLLKEMGVKQPETVAVGEGVEEELARMLEKHERVVVKPVNESHGNGVTTDIVTVEEGMRAVEKILGGAKVEVGAKALMQEQLVPTRPETRVICVGGKFVVALARIPARVTGDGVHTVAELIEIENRTMRTEAYKSDLGYIDEELAREYVERNGLTGEVPAEGEKVQVVATCNLGRGGTVEDATAEAVREGLDGVAEKIAAGLGLPVVGVDFLDGYVLEVNAAPSLYYPERKVGELGVEAWVDYLERC